MSDSKRQVSVTALLALVCPSISDVGSLLANGNLRVTLCNHEREDLAVWLSELSARERQVIILRYGLDDGRERTLVEIGEVLGVTRERVRQIEAEALGKLCSSKLSPRLHEYLPPNGT